MGSKMAQGQGDVSKVFDSVYASAFLLCNLVNRDWQSITHMEHHPFEVLAGELFVLLDTLGSLYEKAVQLHSSENDPPPLPVRIDILEGCRAMVEHLALAFDTLSSQTLVDSTTVAKSYRLKFRHAIDSSSTLQQLYGHLTTHIREDLPQELIDLAEAATMLLDESDVDSEEFHPSADDVHPWLRLLNSPEYDREPEEFFLEKRYAQQRRLNYPEYAKATIQWPMYADMYWDELHPQITALFALPRSFQFVQWALEYAREAWPTEFDVDAVAPDALLDLTDALCDGSASPLHIAAALGLSSLCQKLVLSNPEYINKTGRYGTPLYCAMVGPEVLAITARPKSWDHLLSQDMVSDGRVATILSLLAAKADCTYRFRWQDGEVSTLACLAFWAACVTEEESLFTLVCKQGGAALDYSFDLLLEYPILLEVVDFSDISFCMLLTSAYDLTLALEAHEETEVAEGILGSLEDLLSHSEYNFLLQPDTLKLSHITDTEFPSEVRTAVVEQRVCFLRRLCEDPRFDPNTSSSTSADEGTIAHMAVSGDEISLVSALIEAGSDFTAQDGEGRTPLMVAESLQMLELLVLSYNLPSTDTDNRGRNILHYAAATNDVAMIRWLCDKDPSASENMAAETTAGCTPLVEAVVRVEALRDEPKDPTLPMVPTAAMILLAKQAPLSTPSASRPLSHFAVAWGSSSLVSCLQAAGVEFRDIDPNGKSALHFLNLAASASLVRRVQEACRDMPIYTDDGLTPAETIIMNTALMHFNGSCTPSQHPSCTCEMSPSAYNTLITQEILDYRDYRGRGTWQRFCDVVMPLMFMDLDARSEADVDFVHKSITTAVKCLIRRGALRKYEDETGKPAVACFFKSSDQELPRCLVYLPFIRFTMEHGDTAIRRAFCVSDDGIKLMSEAVCLAEFLLVRYLASNGTPVHVPKTCNHRNTIIETAIIFDIYDMVRLEALSPFIQREHLEDRRQQIFELFVDSHNSLRKSKLELLFQIGLEMDSPRSLTDSGELQPPLLNTAVLACDWELVQILLELGADARLGPNGYNAVFASMDTESCRVVEIILKSSCDFDWDMLYYNDAVSYNVLQYAASRDAETALLELLKHDSLRLRLNDTSPANGSPPLHLAAEADSTACIRALVKAGANLNVLDGDGVTALHVATTARQHSAMECLLNNGIDDVPDSHGRTAFDYAVAMEDDYPGVIGVFSEHALGKQIAEDEQRADEMNED